MRFRKQRSFVYPLLAAGDELASPPLEQIAHAQVAARRAVDRPLPAHPDPVVLRGARAPPLPPPREPARAPGALGAARGRADLDAQPRRDAQRRAHPEPQPVLARDRRSPPTAARPARRLAAAVQARRGENRLHRRWMIVRQRLYRRRFPRALAPLLPSPRALVSAAEVAHLLALPVRAHEGRPGPPRRRSRGSRCRPRSPAAAAPATRGRPARTPASGRQRPRPRRRDHRGASTNGGAP